MWCGVVFMWCGAVLCKKKKVQDHVVWRQRPVLLEEVNAMKKKTTVPSGDVHDPTRPDRFLTQPTHHNAKIEFSKYSINILHHKRTGVARIFSLGMNFLFDQKSGDLF